MYLYDEQLIRNIIQSYKDRMISDIETIELIRLIENHELNNSELPKDIEE